MTHAASTATTPPSVARDSIAPNPYAATISRMAKPNANAATRKTSKRRDTRQN